MVNHGSGLLTISYFISAITADLHFICIVSIPLWIVSHYLKKYFPAYRFHILAFLIGILGLISTLLAIYYTATLTPLGPEFWAYSSIEMFDTVKAAENQLAVKFLLLLLLLAVLYLVIYKALLSIESVSVTIRTWILIATCTAAGMGYIFQDAGYKETISDADSNKLSYFIRSSWENKKLTPKPYEVKGDKEYPFLHTSSGEDVLGPFFNEIIEPPNIVFILIESLGGEFVGENARWGGFAPFIDSLSKEGLYWKNGLSMSGRTFGMVPSLFGSLPPGRNGFMDLGPDYPSHQTLISLLKEQGYYTSFYSGYNTYFDGLNFFLKYQGTDFILNQELITNKFEKRVTQTDSNYWGYDDFTMFDIATIIGDTSSIFPRFEIYHTLQSHSPFTVPNPEVYARKFNQRLNEIDISENQKESFRRYQSELTTLLYSDDALRKFIESYRKREHYHNTIFVITGDHWLIPIPQTSQISRYHVPIIFYSPLVKEPVVFQSVNTHANIAPALTSFLKQSAKLSLPDSVHWIGATMDTSRNFQNIHSLPLMKNKNQVSDFIHGFNFLSDNNLFSLTPNLGLENTVNLEVKNQLSGMLDQFKSKNEYAVINNKLFPPKDENQFMDQYKFIAEYDSLFQSIDSIGLSVDEQFAVARQYAFDGEYEISRVISKRLLLNNPDYHDIRLLLGRTYAWDQSYNKARELFSETIRRDPKYYDSYSALFDAEYWSGNYDAALNAINTGLIHHPKNEIFLEKKIRILSILNMNSEAITVFETFKNLYPNHDKITELEQRIF